MKNGKLMKGLCMAVFITAVTVSAGFAQKPKVVSGNLDFLKGQENVAVKLDLSEVRFYDENLSEQQYIDKRVKEIEEKKSGESADWLADWNDAKTNRFLDHFIAAAEKHAKTGIRFVKEGETPYTLIVKTKWIYPGWFGGIKNQHAKVSSTLTFVETANPGNALLEIEADRVPGDNFFVGTPNHNDRIAQGFAMTGRWLAIITNKGLK
ncbi:hypothetical protein GCM10011386_18740 [Parapedobacter defluvii]|uniref:Uncharacterized protein n=1 Tax=Parapedobacter defluvii TaxID=2045106 RepID=A0ABQ1LMQ9_9SPHI|nr:hypothetical protein [Parapedobacter defluvii]RQP09194.1 MAG: hypothetical protein EAS52_24235 [Parapedobacter sp.]GGC26914.1 hypothetical protein GCM10011386_18740 [Parapedobacter defluvii]